MRRLLALLLIGCVPVAAWADDIPATSAIDAVVVYPQGAEVKRIAKVRIAVGSHAVVFPDLPAEALSNSIRVEGKATGGLEIGTVDSRRLSVPSTDAATVASERRRIEAEIERLRDERAVIGAQAQAAEAQRTFLTNLLQLPNRPQPATGGGGPREDWAQILALIGREMGPAGTSVLEAQVRMREVDRKIKDAEGRLRALAPRIVQRTEVKVAVVARAAVDAELTVTYQVGQAGWRPQYDARLTTGTAAVAPRLTVTRRALVMQRTSEPWERVSLTLSTARPSGRSSAPELVPITVDFPAEPAAPEASKPRPQAMTRQLRTGRTEADAKIAEAAPAAAPVMQPAVQAAAEVTATAFKVLYQIGGRQSVANTNQAKGVVIDETDLRDVQLKVRAAPRQDPRAYLYVGLKVPVATPWLAGQVALFRDATFVGNSQIRQLGPGQTYDLGFGADDSVRVEARATEVTRGETGIISQSKTNLRNWRLVIRNLHARPIGFEIHDQMPVSNNQEIKVELLARPSPTRRNIEDKRGVLAWEDRLGAGEEKTIEFGYRISWPAAKSIVYGR